MALNLSPQIEARLMEAAQQRGQDPDALIEQLLEENYPVAAANASIVLSEKKKAAIAMLDEWLAAMPTDPEQIRKDDAEREEFLQNLNKNRFESGESPLFP